MSASYRHWMECLLVVSSSQRLSTGERRLTLIGRVVRELSLCIVDHHTADDVAAVDENLGEDEPLPEVISTGSWSANENAKHGK